MAVPVIEAASALSSSTSSTSFDLTVPTGSAVGDLMVIVCHSDSNLATAGFASTGFTLGITAGNATIDAHVGILWKPYEATDGSTYTVTQTSTYDFQAKVLRISGASLTTPIHASTSSGGTATSYTFVSGTITSTVADCLWLGLFSFDGGDTSSLPSWSSGATVNQLHSSRTGTGGTNLTTWAGTYDQASTGGNSQVSLTWGGLNDGTIGAHLFIAPSTGPAFSRDGVSGASIATVSGVAAASIASVDGVSV